MTVKSILLVEDNPDDAALTLRAFRKAHILNEIVVAEDGAEALEYIFANGKYSGRNGTDFPALILLDLNLPKVSGIEVLRQMRTDPRTKQIQVVIMTTSREHRDVIAAYELGANSYICKPVDFNQFVTAAQQIGMYWLMLNEPSPELK